MHHFCHVQGWQLAVPASLLNSQAPQLQSATCEGQSCCHLAVPTGLPELQSPPAVLRHVQGVFCRIWNCCAVIIIFLLVFYLPILIAYFNEPEQWWVLWLSVSVLTALLLSPGTGACFVNPPAAVRAVLPCFSIQVLFSTHALGLGYERSLCIAAHP